MATKKVVRYQLVRHKWDDEIQAEKARKRKVFKTILLCILCFVGGFSFSQIGSRHGVQNNETFAKLESVFDIMRNDFYFGKDMKNIEKELMDGAIHGMVNAGKDPHTAYMLPEEAKQFTSSMEGSYVGIGIQYYELQDHEYVVDAVFKGSPAEEAGVQAQDRIYAVEGKSCDSMDIHEIEQTIKGKEGSSVSVTFKRKEQTYTKSIKRRAVAHTVLSKMEGTTGILTLNTFAETSSDEVGMHLKDLKHCKNLILDLRNNGGGYLNAAQNIASYFIPKDDIVFHEKMKDKEAKAYKALDLPKYKFEHIYILINERSASAAEVLTMALRENKSINVHTVGVKSYGKGSVQVPLTFKDGSYIKYTVAQWLTPSKHCIDGIGITPDYEVSLDPALTCGVPALDQEVYESDSVSEAALCTQIYLKFLGYPVDRVDAYFSHASSEALKQYQKDVGLTVNGCISKEVLESLMSSVGNQWRSKKEYDTQMMKALELANGR